MATLDWVFVGILLGSGVVGAWRGLVFELLSLLGWVAAYFAARWCAPQVATWLPFGDAEGTVRFVAGFALVFIVVLFGCGFLAWLAKRLVAMVGVRPVDRALGALFGVARGVALLLLATAGVEWMTWNASPWWQESQGAPWLALGLERLKPALPEGLGRHLPS